MQLHGQPFRYFLAVAQDRSIRGAADRLRISQSAVSRQIQNLELSLGYPLFDRGARGIALTPAGRVLLRYINETALLSKDLQQELDQLAGLQSGHVSVAVVEGFTTSKFPQLLAAYRENNPAVTLEVIIDGSQSIQDGLENERYDLGVLFNPHSDRLNIHIASRHSLCALMAPDHPLSRHRTLTVEQILSYPLVVPAVHGGSRELYNALLRSVRAPIKPALETNSAHIAAAFLTSSQGVGILSPHSARRYIDDGTLIYVTMQESTLDGTLAVASKRGRKLSAASSVLCTVMCRTIADL
ncbi:LysR family transcriptional regulator [Mesorhizobium sp. CAU 1741]|uniref:LysR family transcriptional regulator n=1 Tax=Mesorhizobium sp. CAU 1741 TaxID=3140366 RepID=UPI00325BAEEB